MKRFVLLLALCSCHEPEVLLWQVDDRGYFVAYDGGIPAVPEAGVLDLDATCQPEFCFDAEWWRATNPPCRVGFQPCGSSECIGEVLPTEDFCGDAIDSDCDGTADNGDGRRAEPLDIALLLDTSCSMLEVLIQVKPPLQALVERLRPFRPNYYVIMIPGDPPAITYSGNVFCNPVVGWPIGPCADVDEAIARWRPGRGSEENIYDVLTELDSLVAWRAGSRRIALFIGDEEGQSRNGLTAQDIMPTFETISVVRPDLFGDYAYSLVFDIFDPEGLSTSVWPRCID